MGIIQAAIMPGFRTTNCYGLSLTSRGFESMFDLFPYNELLWFINSITYDTAFSSEVSVQRIVMVYQCNLI